MLKIIKNISRYFLREELEHLNRAVALARESERDCSLSENNYWTQLAEANAMNFDLVHRTNEIQKELFVIKNNFINGNKKVISVLIFETLIKMLPNPNIVNSNPSEIRELKCWGFADASGGHCIDIKKFGVTPFESRYGRNGVSITFEIKDYDLSITFLSFFRQINQTVSRVKTDIGSYIWDVNSANLQIITNESWDQSFAFIRMSSKVFKENGLL